MTDTPVHIPAPYTPPPADARVADALSVAALELLPSPALVLDPAGTVVLANAAARALAARPPVGLGLLPSGLHPPGSPPVGCRVGAEIWSGPPGARRLHVWTDTPLPGGGLLVTAEDHTRQHRAVEGLRTAATTDALTGLVNRPALLESLARALAGTAPVVVLFCDLDGFKAINDEHGHAAGDLILEAVAARLRQGVRSSDVVARLGGDEFVVVSPGLATDVAEKLVKRLVRNIAQPLVLPQGLFTVKVSIGLAVGQPGTDVEALLAQADGQMYREKTWRTGLTPPNPHPSVRPGGRGPV